MVAAMKPTSRLRRVLAVAAAALVGMTIGVAVFGVGFSELPSYFSSDPHNCTNCHVMQQQYDAWEHGAHQNVATCDDCHLPHDNIISQLRVQATDGLLHSYKFTTNSYPTNIVIRPSSLEVVNQACLYCHGMMTSNIHLPLKPGETITCTNCHANVGHEKFN